jgi:hypothetical protein
MNKPLLIVLPLCLSTLVVHSSYASSSISTRVKVVEDKVRVHDKKIKDIKAQQEVLNRNMANARTATPVQEHPTSAAKPSSQPTAKPAVKEKTEAELRQERAVAAARAKQRAEAEARAKHERLAAMYRARYAYP